MHAISPDHRAPNQPNRAAQAAVAAAAIQAPLLAAQWNLAHPAPSLPRIIAFQQ